MISVILPTYNNEKTIFDSIKSILNQTYRDFELIIINDCSNDKTEEVIKSFNDERIIYLENDINLGGAGSRNKGIEKAKGDFIAMMDGDDIAIPERLEIQLNYLKNNPNITLVASNIVYFTNYNVSGVSDLRIHDPKDFKFYLRPLGLPHPTWMARSSFFKNFKYYSNIASEDFELLLRGLDSSKYAVIKEPLLFYNVPEDTKIKYKLNLVYSMFLTRINFVKKRKMLYFLPLILTIFILSSIFYLFKIKTYKIINKFNTTYQILLDKLVDQNIQINNIDNKTIQSFGDEWLRFDQRGMTNEEALNIFKNYFSLFSFNKLPKDSVGFDMGCGSGRWAKFVAPKVGLLHCIDPSAAIQVAKNNLKDFKNIKYHQQSLDECKLEEKSQDFGYSLGVLHHVPNTTSAIKSCVKLLKPGAPFLLYIYYSFDNRPIWFKFLWVLTDYIRLGVHRLPNYLKFLICDFIAFFIYYPLARFTLIFEKIGLELKNFPLYFYRSKSFYVMRTDSRDRFGTPLEKRFSKKEINEMMIDSGLENIKFKDSLPFWTAIGFKKK